MALMTWTNKFSVGVETLDHQHRALMNALNELHAAAMRGKASEVADSLIRQIVSISHEHFAAEARHMESIRFPGLAAHRAKHRELAAQFREFAGRHENGDTAVYTEMLYFMRDWQIRHMQTDDQEYVDWMRTHDVQ